MDTTHIDFASRHWWAALRLLDAREQQALIIQAYRSGWISDWQLWDVLSSERSPVAYPTALALYQLLGYLPFHGYPLTPAIKEE